MHDSSLETVTSEYRKESFADGNDGWSCDGITKCGTWGDICGAYKGNKGRGATISKTFTGFAAGHYTASLTYFHIDSWDHEYGEIFVNGEHVWTSDVQKHGNVNHGDTDMCSSPDVAHAWYRTDVKSKAVWSFEVPASGNFEVTVKSTLTSHAGDESFGIGNIKIHQINPVYASPTFEAGMTPAYDGWKCGGITKCGKWGDICGAYQGNKGRGATISKTFTGMEVGRLYTFQARYYHIDSWDREHGFINIDGKRVWTSPTIAHGNVGHREHVGDTCSANGVAHAWYRTDVDSQAKFTFRPTTSTFTMTFGSNLNSGANDESFGISDVVIY
jgi:hypothetical protein